MRFLPAACFWLMPVEASEPEFNRDIRPILSRTCFVCHGPDAAQRKADLRLDQRDAAVQTAIVPGNAAASPVIQRITSEDPEIRMPPPDSRHQLTADQIQLIREWIQTGAKYQAHWSLIPPQQTDPPRSMNGVIFSSAIDAFVERRLSKASLSFSVQADPAELLRRVSLDLTGLPPDPRAVEMFESDPSAANYERFVDRLLASERYGEHMARYWLDAARYADTNGYQYDLEREQWVWRDWVIHAFNSNMPFDQFTIEQLAGDLLPDATDQQVLATAFHRNHPITIEGGVIDEEYRTEYVVDRVVTTATVWMGTTMLCSRCHDHKYDPISQREFYQLFAFFNQLPERGHNGFAPKRKIESPIRAGRKKVLEEQIELARSRLLELGRRRAAELENGARRIAGPSEDPWATARPTSMKSSGGADLRQSADGQILATGKNPATDVYEIFIPIQRDVHAIRLEALTHPSHVSGSTGRGSNGNFVLSEFELAVSETEDSSTFQNREIQRASADYSQSGFGIEKTIDGKIDRTGWAVDGNTRFMNSTATFIPAKPIIADGKRFLRLRMHHAYGLSHQIGHFRLSMASVPVMDLDPELRMIARMDPTERSADQQIQLIERVFLDSRNDDANAAIHRWRDLTEATKSLARVPETMIMMDQPNPRTTRVLQRGEYNRPAEQVEPGTPAALPLFPNDAPRNRLGLARWLVSADHPLTGRVAVNRFWHQLFGTGIVATVEDFGSQGEWPSHPELLDWLAVDFRRSGWDVKRLLKQLVMSRTYRQTSVANSERLRIDPANRLLSRGPRIRLDAEVIRDCALAAAGLLDDRVGGPSVFPYQPPGLWQEINNRPGYSRTYQRGQGRDLYRRSLYTFWKRTLPPPSMAVFDAPEREYCVVRRSRTNTPLQAIVLLHDPQYVEAARHLALRMLARNDRDTEQLVEGFRICCARRPTERELKVLKEMLSHWRRHFNEEPEAAISLLQVGESTVPPGTDHRELAAWTSIGRVLLNLSEFVTKG